jgi:hypothetical protein
MSAVKDTRKPVSYITPMYAAVGITDLAVETVRDLRVRAASVRLADVTAIQDKAVKRVEKVSVQAQQLPVLAMNQTLEAAEKAQETYAGLAKRGQKLVKRVRNQKSTKDLFAQAGSTVSLGKGAVTTVRKAATDTQRAAKATLTTGRREAGSVVDAVTSSAKGVKGEAKTATRTVRKSAVASKTSAKRTATTAKKSVASVQRATTTTAASAVDTAAAATTAAKTATPKLGD